MDPLVLEVNPISRRTRLIRSRRLRPRPPETASWCLLATGSRSIAELAISDKEAWTPQSAADRPAFRLTFPPLAQQCGR